MQAVIYVLLVGIITGLVGWINQDYVKEQANWFTTMRPYMLANVRPHVLTAEAEQALEAAGELPRMCQGLSRDDRHPGRRIHDGFAADGSRAAPTTKGRSTT